MMIGMINRSHGMPFWLLVFMLTIKPVGLALAVNPGMADLQRKMGEIASLREAISEKVAQGIRIRERFKEQSRRIGQEIKDEYKAMGTPSFEMAISSPRIDYDLRLLQQYYAYLSAIDGRLAYFRTAHEHLAYLLEQAEDDIKIFETLKDMDIYSLIIRIDKVVNEYLPEAQRALINVEHMRLSELENVWNDIIKNNSSP